MNRSTWFGEGTHINAQDGVRKHNSAAILGKLIGPRLLMRPAIENHDEIILADPTELGFRLLLEKVRVDGFAPQEIDFRLPALMLVLESGEIGVQAGDLALVIILGLQATLAVDGMPQEIAADRAGNAIEKKG